MVPREGVRQVAERRVVSVGICLGIVLSVTGVTVALLLHPGVATSAPAAIGLTAMVVLFGAYGCAAWVAHRPRTAEAATALVIGGRFAFAVGGCWIVELVAGNVLGDQPFSRPMYAAALLGVVLGSVGAGAMAASRTGRFADGVAAGFWSGVTTGWVPLFALLLIVALLPGTVSADPQNVAQAAHAGAPNVLEFAIGDDLVAGVNHLWLGPSLGLVLGAIGAAIGQVVGTSS